MAYLRALEHPSLGFLIVCERHHRTFLVGSPPRATNHGARFGVHAVAGRKILHEKVVEDASGNGLCSMVIEAAFEKPPRPDDGALDDGSAFAALQSDSELR